MSKNEILISWFKECIKNVSVVVVSLVLCLLVVEIMYRYQWFDFYKSEITYLNKSTKEKKCSKKVLIFGDSFSASPNNYVTLLNDTFSDILFINSAIPGIGAQEIHTIAKNRINQFKPEIVVVQLYVGNDLIDIKKPMNWNTVSYSRNIYWYLSRFFYSIRYFNYKLGQFKYSIGIPLEQTSLRNNEAFSIHKFSDREKVLVAADPFYLDKSIFVTEDYKDRYETYLTNLLAVVELCKEQDIKVKILVIPANCQVNEHYRKNINRIGAKFNNASLSDTLYPFISQLTEMMHSNNANVQVLNPLATFQQNDSLTNRLYYENDIHLNMNGDRVLAEFVGKNFNN